VISIWAAGTTTRLTAGQQSRCWQRSQARRRQPGTNRAFLRRAVRFLARDGIRQFIDLGAGLPSAGAVHEIARTIDPSARVAYVDSDPVVVAHARALLADSPSVAVIEAAAASSAAAWRGRRRSRPERPALS
jgi:hypothetical protein